MKMADHDVRRRRTVMSLAQAAAAHAGNVARPLSARAGASYMSVADLNDTWPASNQEDRKDHCRGSRYSECRRAAHLVDQDSDEKTEQCKAVKAWNDSAY